MTNKKIFISYKDDKTSIDFARDLTEKLQEEGDIDEVFNFKAEKQLPPGVDWLNYIRKHIGDCDVLIAVITREYLQSDMCCKEFIGAFYSNKVIIPLLIGEELNLDECRYNLKNEINRLQYIKIEGIALNIYDRILLGIRWALHGKSTLS